MTYFQYFDTVSYIYSYKYDTKTEFESNCAIAEDVLSYYHKLFDIYYEYEGVTNLCTINKNAGKEALTVDRELIVFLEYCKELYELTGGKMNPMLGSVLRIWHDARTLATENPSQAALPALSVLEEADRHTDFGLLEIDESKCTVRISDPAASIDVGAVAKGYAVEMAARALEEKGITSYVFNVGGNIRIIGTKPDGDGWVTGIKDPKNPDYSYSMYLKISDTACVTSGVYERFFTVNGNRYHHIIDPDTLMPADYFDSVTILTEHSGLADALSTALFCMSYADGKALIEAIPGVEAVWIFGDGSTEKSSGVTPFDYNNKK
ncbi:MAG: FAD:protein FMN transferase [Clostridia bacterium]|nr:FAD:protein FMN transferase [Clostridia bacterium]